MVQTIGEQELILNLKAAGFDGALIQQFLRCWKSGLKAEQLRILSQKRADLLHQVHQEEKQINCLDYLVYRIEKVKEL